MAKPISLNPSQYWDGNDGRWSTFSLLVGSDLYRVLPATSTAYITLVAAEACLLGFPGIYAVPPDCSSIRGSTLNHNNTNDFQQYGQLSAPFYSENSLPYFDDSGWGLVANVTLGNNADDAEVAGQLVISLIDLNPFLGTMGLTGWQSHPLNALNSRDGILRTLNGTNQIPGAYYAYHAGAQYRDPKNTQFASLTLGGYDSLRGNVRDFVVPFSSDSTRDLLVSLSSITIYGGRSNTNTFRPSETVSILIDSLVTELWLPLELCQAFESEFGLVWNSTFSMYFVNDSQHEQLLAANPNVTISLASPGNSSLKTDITLPYAAFDLEISFYLHGYTTTNDENSRTRYFPLKRAANSTQYFLGRTFLQEAYVTADYDRRQFSVSQAIFPSDPTSKNITKVYGPGRDPALQPTRITDIHSSSSLSPGIIAGIAIGIFAALALIVFTLIYFFCWRPRKARREQERRNTWGGSTLQSDTLAAPEQEFFAQDVKNVDANINTITWLGGVDSENEQSKQELDATHTVRARDVTNQFERHELDGGTSAMHGRYPSESTAVSAGVVSPVAGARPGGHERLPSDPASTSSYGVPSPPSPQQGEWLGPPLELYAGSRVSSPAPVDEASVNGSLRLPSEIAAGRRLRRNPVGPDEDA